MPKHAGLGAAILVLLAISGLIVLVGVIFAMMLLQPNIQHSPSAHNGKSVRSTIAAGGMSTGGRP